MENTEFGAVPGASPAGASAPAPVPSPTSVKAAPGSGVLTVISLGAGVQSSALALMAAHGLIKPMPDCAIFADTRSEPDAVYEWLAWLEASLPFPVYRVSAGSLRGQILDGMAGIGRIDGRPPFFVAPGGMLNRQCTSDFEIDPIQRKVGELIGHKPGSRWPLSAVVEQWIGISTDEVQRAKPSRLSAIRHRFPLVEAGFSRSDCLAWFDSLLIPRPPRSACTFCPYHDDAYWRDLKRNDFESFAGAVLIDEAIRPGIGGGGEWFVHRSRTPLASVDFRTAEEAGQLAMFDEEGFAVECEGMCGV